MRELHNVAFAAALSAASLVPSADAQNYQPAPFTPVLIHQGMFAAYPAGVLTRTGPILSGGTQALRVRRKGFGNGNLLAWENCGFPAAGVNYPDFSEAELFDWTPSGTMPELSAFSTGGDVCPEVDSNGRLLMSVEASWLALTISVNGGAVGLPGGAVESLAEPENHLLTYCAEGSTGIRQNYVDTVTVEYTPSQVGVLPTEEIVGFDWGMGLISSSPGQGVTTFQPMRERFYFSLTVVGAAMASSGSDVYEAGAVYVLEWDGLDWQGPTLAFSQDELLGANAGSNVIDALGVFDRTEYTGAIERVVFSLTPDSDFNGGDFDQILVTQFVNSNSTTGPVAVPLSVGPAGAAIPVSEKFGLQPVEFGAGNSVVTEPDDVTDMCPRDPKEHDWFSPWYGFVQDEVSPTQPAFVSPFGRSNELVGLSVLRTPDAPGGAGAAEILLAVTGMDTARTPGIWASHPGTLIAFESATFDVTDQSDPIQITPWATTPAELQFPAVEEVSLVGPAPLPVPGVDTALYIRAVTLTVDFGTVPFTFDPAGEQTSWHVGILD